MQGFYTPESGIVVLNVWLASTLIPAGLTPDTLHTYSPQLPFAVIEVSEVV